MTLPRTPSFRLDGRRALVAGASSGIGAAAAVALAEQGAEVTLCARREAELGPWRMRCGQRDAGRDPAARHHRRRRDGSGAGRTPRLRRSGELRRAGAALARPSTPRPEDFDVASNLNFRAAYFLTRAVAARLIAEGKPGSLINISSQMAHVGGIDRAVYSATKHAVEGMTKIDGDRMGAARHPRQHHRPDLHPHRPDRRNLRQPRTRRLDRVKDQAEPGGRGRGHHGRGRLPGLGRGGADHRNFTHRRWRLDRRIKGTPWLRALPICRTTSRV